MPPEPTDHEPARNHPYETNIIAALVSGALVLVAAACGATNDNESDADASDHDVHHHAMPAATGATTAPAPDPTSPPTTGQVEDETWRDEVDALCSYHLTSPAIPAPGGDAASLEAYVAAHRERIEQAPAFPAVDFSGPGRTPEDLSDLTAGIDDALAHAAEAAAAGDLAGTLDRINAMGRHLEFFASAFASEGQSCGPADAERAAKPVLNVSILGPWQVEVGFGSVWISQSLSDTVLSIDPRPGTCSPGSKCRRAPSRRPATPPLRPVDAGAHCNGRARCRLRPAVRHGRPRDRLIVQRGSR